MTFSKFAPLVALALLTAGCSFNPVGESTFDCNRKENPSEYCRSFKALEKSTDGTLPESRFDKEFRMSDYDRANGLAPDAPAESKAANQPSGNAPLALLLPHNRTGQSTDLVPGAPVRRAPVIQRVLIKQFVDENDMLQGDVVVYKEVQASKWTGFDASRAAASGGGQVVYPHKVQDVPATGGEVASPASQGPGFVQPESNAEGAGGTATPPAVSGGK
jgi:conjugal transfer pilus assembly protein TraV